MRRVLSLAGASLCLFGLSLTPLRADVCATFDEVPLSGGYWNGSDLSGGFSSQAVQFRNVYNTNWYSWAGFACSRVNDTNTAGWGNQYAVISGTGAGGTGQYAIVYDDGAWGNADAVTLPVACQVKGFHVNNTTYTYLEMRDGGMTRKFVPGDWFKLTVTGRDADGDITGTCGFYLADLTSSNSADHYIVKDWTWLSLTNLGTQVKTLEFALSSSDNDPMWGMNTPAYFAMDNLTTAESYAPAAGLPGSTAVAVTSATIVAWATGWTNYVAGDNCDPMWQTPQYAAGPADSNPMDGTTGIVCLGDSGRITLTFDPPIQDGPGPDFAIFENATPNDAAGKAFLEHAWVEVSSDGTNFIRFFNRSITPAPASSYGTIGSTNVIGLGCKYKAGFGEPYDLGQFGPASPGVDLQHIRYVRLIDIIGNGSCTDSVGHVIYDPYPVSGSAGFDLDGIGVLSNAQDEVNVSATLTEASESGPQRGEIVVWRKTWNPASNCAVRLTWSGTASNGLDYSALPETVVIPAGRLSTALSIVPLADATPEGRKTVIAEVQPQPEYGVGASPRAKVWVSDAAPSGFTQWQTQSLQAEFDALPVSAADYWNGADLSGGFSDAGAWFSNTYNTNWSSWAGFAYSRVNDTNTPGWENQYAVISGTGLGGTGIYAIAYDDGPWGNSDVVTLPHPCRIKGVFVNNTTYAARDMEAGTPYVSKKFGGASGNDPDWFKLTVTGRDGGGSVVGTTEFYLADYRFDNNTQDYIVRTWTWLSLTNFGPQVKTLEFGLSSSDNGLYGMNTPAYFALDGLEIDPSGPDAADEADWNNDGVPNLLAYTLGYPMGRTVPPASLTAQATNQAGTAYFEVEFRRRHGMADASLSALYTPRLTGGAWVGGPGHIQETVSALADGVDQVRARVLDSATNGIGFVRLQAIRP